MVYNTPYQIGSNPSVITSGTYNGATMTNIAVSSRNMPMNRYDNCIIISTSHGLKSHLVMNSDSIARTAPMPSNTAPKHSAARIIHMNMHEMPSVFRMVSSMTLRVSRRFASAASVAAVAPTAELSTKLVMPMTNKPVMKKKIKNGMMPARSSFSFSPSGMVNSSRATVGPRCGCALHRTTI